MKGETTVRFEFFFFVLCEPRQTVLLQRLIKAFHRQFAVEPVRRVVVKSILHGSNRELFHIILVNDVALIWERKVPQELKVDTE